jgi:hypothetical protein
MSQMVFVRIIVVVDYYALLLLLLLLLLFVTLVFSSFSSRRVCLAFVRCISISRSLISDLILSHQKHLIMMRAQTGRHHGATVGLFLRSLVLDISSFIFDASYTLAAQRSKISVPQKTHAFASRSPFLFDQTNNVS